MDDFYKSLKENLENRPEPPFEEGAWRALEGRLNHWDYQSARGVVWPWWAYLLLALLPLSLILNGWLFWQGQKVQTPLPHPTNATSSIADKIDTVLLTRIVIHSDTIYRTKVIRERNVSPVNFARGWSTALNRNIDQWNNRFLGGEAESRANDAFSYRPISDIIRSNRPLNPIDQLTYWPGAFSPAFDQGEENKAEKPVSEWEKTLAKVRQSRFRLNIPVTEDDLGAYALPIGYYKPTKPPWWEKIQPQGFSAGVQGSISYPFLKKGDEVYALYQGVQLNILFPNRFELWGEFGKLNINYRIDEMGEAYGIPIVESPGNEYTFRYTVVAQPRLHFGGGLKYSFSRLGSKWRPMIELGYSSLFFLPYEVFYEFEDRMTETEIRLEGVINRKDGPYHYLISRAGYEMMLNKRFKWQLLGEFRYSFSNDTFINPHLIGFKTGVSYRF